MGASGQSGAGQAGSGPGGVTGVAGSGPGTAGRGGSSAGRGGSSAGRGGTTGSAGVGGYAGSTAGTTGAAGSGSNPAGTLAGDVTFSVPSQAFKGQLSVGMTTAIANAEIRYTTDGTLPTASSMRYSGTPLMLSVSTELRAQPFVGGTAAGLVSTGLYIARTFDLTSKLPIMILDSLGRYAAADITANNMTNKKTYRSAAVMIFEPSSGGTASVANLPTVVSRGAFHLRGQSSSGFPQKPYKVELRDNADGDAKYAIAGMAADADWAIIPPYYDRSLLRNPFTYSLGQDMGMNAPNTAFMEVYLNFKPEPAAETDYQGIYWFSETIKINGHRTDLKKLDAVDTTEPTISGGYIFKFDQAATDASSPRPTCKTSTGVTCWTDCELTDPVPLPAPTEQLAWITQYIQSFHNTLFTTPLGSYSQYINVASFVDYLIINELTRNTDSYVRSAYFHKDRGMPLEGGPLWDYNFALGIGGQAAASATPLNTSDGGWMFQGKTAGSLPGRNVNSWFPKLMTDPTFVAAVKARWKSLRQGLLSQAQIDARINKLVAQLPSDAIAHDYGVWPVSKPYPNGGPGGTGIRVYGPVAPTWDGQVQALRDWITARVTWIDSQWQ